MPTLQQLKTMKGSDGSPLKIIETIADGDYQTFGLYLLQDKSSVPKAHFYRGAVNVTKTILKKWLKSGAPTCTYQHLIDCLRQSKLGTLADLIAACSKSVKQGALADPKATSIEQIALAPKATSIEQSPKVTSVEQGMPCNIFSML